MPPCPSRRRNQRSTEAIAPAAGAHSPRSASFDEGLLCSARLRRLAREFLSGARPGEDAPHAVVCLVARILEYQLVAPLHCHGHRPGPRPDGGIVNRVLVDERVGIEAAEPLGQVQILVTAESEATQAQRAGSFATEVPCLDDERA